MLEVITPLIFALTLTLLSEMIIYYFLKPQSLKLIITVLIMNVFLNVLMNVILTLLVPSDIKSYYITLIIGEVLVVILETIIIYFINKTPLFKTFLFALFANGVSLWLGLLNNNFKIIDSTKVTSLYFSGGFVIVLCIALYLLFLFVPNNKQNRNNNGQANHQD